MIDNDRIIDYLDLDQPKISNDDVVRFLPNEQKNKDSNKNQNQKSIQLFENEDERDLYQNIIDLKDHVPDSVLNLKKQQIEKTPIKEKSKEKIEVEEVKYIKLLRLMKIMYRLKIAKLLSQKTSFQLIHLLMIKLQVSKSY